MKHLVIMAKQPVSGRVKSRLAKDIGNVKACGVYRNLLTETMRRLAPDRRWKTWAAISPDTAVIETVWSPDVSPFPQGHGNLGTRMQRIFNTIPTGSTIIIGTDIPSITSTDIANAFKLLGQNDVVFGEAGDGGYWLVGAKRTPRVPDMFGNVRWSSEHALADTQKNCQGLKIAYAAERYDIDTKANYLKWRKSKLRYQLIT